MPRSNAWLCVMVLTAISAHGQTTKPRFIPPPDGAIVLFDGHDLTHWRGDGFPHKRIGWTVADGALIVEPGAKNIETKENYGNCRLHLEFRTPTPTKGNSDPMAGNSGVFLMSQYEVQICDSYRQKPEPGGCGALYSLIAPSKNMALPPMEWQSFDIDFRQPKFEKGKKIEDAHITLVWNGETVLDNVPIPKATRDPKAAEKPGPGPVVLQELKYPVQFRNIWLLQPGH